MSACGHRPGAYLFALEREVHVLRFLEDGLMPGLVKVHGRHEIRGLLALPLVLKGAISPRQPADAWGLAVTSCQAPLPLIVMDHLADPAG